MAAMRNGSELYTSAPIGHIGRKGDQFGFTGEVRSFEHASLVADADDAKRGVHCAVCFDESIQKLAERFWRNVEIDVHQRRIVLHAPVVTLKRKQHALADAKSAEYTPAIHESRLARRKQQLGGGPNLIVMEQVSMH